jgi:hypothetical protein
MLFNYIKNNSLTIIIASLIILKQNIMQRTSFFKFKVKIYEETTYYKASLMFILYETLKKKSTFLNFLFNKSKTTREFVLSLTKFILLFYNNFVI